MGKWWKKREKNWKHFLFFPIKSVLSKIWTWNFDTTLITMWMIFGEIFISIRVRKQKLWTPKDKKITENIEFWSQKQTFLPPVAEPDHLESSNFLSRCSEECRYENMHRLSKSAHYIAVSIILQNWNEPKNGKYRATDANPRYDTGWPVLPVPSLLFNSAHTLYVFRVPFIRYLT